MNLFWLTVAVILAFQASYFWQSRRSGRRVFGVVLKEVLNDSKRDLEARATRGEAPDWLRYSDDADRAVLPSSDRVRNFATAALATGVGGTMLALLVELGTNPSLRWALAGGADDLASFDSLPSLVSGALLVSVAGVVNHLVILLLLIPRLDRRIDLSLGEFRAALQAASDEHPPRQTFVDSVRTELGTAFNSALQSLPDAFAEFGKNVSGLQESSTALAASAAEIGPVASGLAGAIEEVRGLPGELARVLTETREAWREDIRSDQQEFLSGIKDVLVQQQELLAKTTKRLETMQRDTDVLIRNLSADIAGEIKNLPDVFSGHASKAADLMGTSLERQVRNLVGDLEGTVKSGNKELVEHFRDDVAALNSTFLNRTSEVVEAAVVKVYEHPLFNTLDGIGKGLKEAIQELPDQAKSFSERLAVADQKLRGALEGIERAGTSLRRVAESTEGFENALQIAMQRSLEPLSEELAAFAADLRSTQGQMNEHADGLVAFIKNLIGRLERQSRDE